MSTTKKLAVLIDADNISADVIEYLLLEINKYGIASVKRIYGDWTDNKLNKWKDTLLPYAITPIQQFAYTNGKNATDMAMVIDAMDLLYSNTFDGFCLVSSDSDFTRLASRIRESGLEVIGFGQNKTPEAFVKACDKFVRTELLMPIKEVPTVSVNDAMATHASPTVTTTNPITILTSPSIETIHKPDHVSTATNLNVTPDFKHLTSLIKQACQAHADDEGWTKLGTVGTYLTRVMPDFDVRSYRFDKLSNLIRSQPSVFEIKSDGKVLSIKPKSHHRWSKEQLQDDAELLSLVAEHIQKNANPQGWADFNRVIQGIGSKKLAKYGYAKPSVLFENIDSVQLHRKNKVLWLKSIAINNK